MASTLDARAAFAVRARAIALSVALVLTTDDTEPRALTPLGVRTMEASTGTLADGAVVADQLPPANSGAVESTGIATAARMPLTLSLAGGGVACSLFVTAAATSTTSASAATSDGATTSASAATSDGATQPVACLSVVRLGSLATARPPTRKYSNLASDGGTDMGSATSLAAVAPNVTVPPAVWLCARADSRRGVGARIDAISGVGGHLDTTSVNGVGGRLDASVNRVAGSHDATSGVAVRLVTSVNGVGGRLDTTAVNGVAGSLDANSGVAVRLDTTSVNGVGGRLATSGTGAADLPDATSVVEASAGCKATRPPITGSSALSVAQNAVDAGESSLAAGAGAGRALTATRTSISTRAVGLLIAGGDAGAMLKPAELLVPARPSPAPVPESDCPGAPARAATTTSTNTEAPLPGRATTVCAAAPLSASASVFGTPGKSSPVAATAAAFTRTIPGAAPLARALAAAGVLDFLVRARVRNDVPPPVRAVTVVCLAAAAPKTTVFAVTAAEAVRTACLATSSAIARALYRASLSSAESAGGLTTPMVGSLANTDSLLTAAGCSPTATDAASALPAVAAGTAAVYAGSSIARSVARISIAGATAPVPLMEASCGTTRTSRRRVMDGADSDNSRQRRAARWFFAS